MSGYLLDTVLVSEFIKTRPEVRVREWLASISPAEQFISVVTLGEIETGIEMLPTGKRRELLRAWAAELPSRFSDRILTVDLETGRLWGHATASLRRRGLNVPTADVLIAATALRHELSIVTRNERHFHWAGAETINPWRR